MGDNKKIFDDFPTVDCNECESWWLNQCDGVTEGSQKLCTAFKAVRRVNIPLKIERLEKALKWLTRGMLVLGVLIIVLLGMVVCG
jgi:hypothetical protein